MLLPILEVAETGILAKTSGDHHCTYICLHDKIRDTAFAVLWK